MPLTYKIFLASPRDMEEHRLGFGDIVQQLNQRQKDLKRQVNFTLYKWEWDTASFAERRKQDTYNDEITTCHIFVMLYGPSVGSYTAEEYDYAYNRLVETSSPRVFVFKCTSTTSTDNSAAAFDGRVREHQQFKGRYDDLKDLRTQFFDEIEKLFVAGVLKKGVPATTLHSDGNGLPPNFIGRQEELKAIRERLDEGGKLMLINAEGGIGKTTLAAKYWQESLYDYRHNAWLFCENGIVSELKKLAPQLNVDLTQYKREEDQVEALKRALQNISHEFLLVLDNANDPRHLEVFRQTFRGFHWHVLITSRCKNVLEGDQELEITHLPPPLAKELFVSNYKEDTPEFDTLLDRLLAALHYHTLLVEVFSKNMPRLRRRGETLADLLAHLETHGLFLAERSFEVVTEYTGSRHRTAATTDDILNILYDFSELAEEERYWMVNMALLPASQHDFVFLCELFEQDRFKFNIPDNLASRGWLIPDETGFRISPVVQSLLLKKNAVGLKEDAKALVDMLNKKLEHDGKYLKNFNEAAPYVGVVETITVHLMGCPSIELSRLSDSVYVYHIKTGNLEAAAKAAENTLFFSAKTENLQGLGVAYERFGDLAKTKGDLDQAESYFRKYLEIYEALQRDYPGDVSFKNGLGISYERLGDLAETKGDLDQAEFYFSKNLEVFQSLRKDHPSDLSFKNGLGIAYSRLGDVAQKKGELDLAESYFRKDYEISESLHKEYPSDISFRNGLGIAYSRLGYVAQKKGEPGRTEFYFRKKLEISESLHNDYPGDVSFKYGLGLAYEKFGNMAKTKGELDQAEFYFTKRLEISESLHNDSRGDVSFKHDLSIAYSKLGNLAKMKDELDQAEFYFRKRLEISESLHNDYSGDVSFKNALAIAYANMALLLESKRADKPDIVTHFENAEKLWMELTAQFPGYPEFANFLESVRKNLQRTRDS